jgi:FixJ family two-component response regulator
MNDSTKVNVILNKKFVYLVEDDDDLRSDLERALQGSGYTIFAFANPEQFLSAFEPLVPAVLVTDMRMPKINGIQLQADLLKQGHQLPIIFISGESSDEQIIKAFRNGAFDFLLKPFSREAFLSAVAKATEQSGIVGHELDRKARFADALKTLTPRERQVFSLMAKGYGNKELVDELGIALATVKQYKSEVMGKLCLSSLADLIALNVSFDGE